VARDEASAFLTKHLRSYGGTGEYEGHKIGRLLRNVSFSGKGLVNNPANPRSVILTESNPFTRTEAKSINQLDITKEKHIMSNDERLLQQVEELKAQLKSTKEELQAKANEATSEELETFKTTVAEKDETITELQEAAKALEDKMSENEVLAVKQTEELSEANQQILSYEKEAITLARRNSLTDVGVGSDEATSILEAFTEADDKMFDELVKQLSKFVPFKKDDPRFKDDDEDDKDKKKKKKDADHQNYEKKGKSEEVSEEEDEAEASAEEEILENVEEEVGAALVDAGETDGIKSVRAIASEWLSQNVLRTTANIDS
jgi:chromosome segregation ATPase